MAHGTRSKDVLIVDTTPNRIELPRESLRKIAKNKVKRTTALFEVKESNAPSYPYKPSSPAEKTGNVKRESNVPNYPYQPKPEPSVSNVQSSTRPSQLNVKHTDQSPPSVYEIKAKKASLASASGSHVTNKDDNKTDASEKRISTSIADRAKLFQNLKPPSFSKLQAPEEADEEDDVTPTNDTEVSKGKNLYSKVDKSSKKAQGDGSKIATLQRQLSLDATLRVGAPKGSKVVLSPPGPKPGPARPPPKPPRTFEHDDYMKIKHASALRTASSPGQIDDSESSHPFYEENKLNGTIKRKAKKEEENHKPSAVMHPKSSGTLHDQVGLYEEIGGLSELVDKSPVDKPTPPLTSTKPMPPPRLKVIPGQGFTSADSKSKPSPPNPYHDQAKVMVMQPILEQGRKLNNRSRRGIENPAYGGNDECLPITVCNPGLMKRYRSEECLYAEPVLHPYTKQDAWREEDVSEYDTTNSRRYRSRRGTEASTYAYAAHKHVHVDSTGYSAPDNDLNRHIREKVSEAYSLLRRPRPADKSTSGGTPGTSGPSRGRLDSTEDEDSDNEVDSKEQTERVQYSRTRRQTNGETAIYARAMLPQKTGNRQLFSYALIVGLEKQEDNIYTPKVLFSFPYQLRTSWTEEFLPKDTNLSMIASFCFPDAANWRPVSLYESESFSFVLTNSLGQRQYGYCRRLLPPAQNADRLPEVYCIISSHQLWNFYNDLLEEVQNIRLKSVDSLDLVQDLLKAAYSRPLPDPGGITFIPYDAQSRRRQSTIELRRKSEKRFEKASYDVLLEQLSLETIIKIISAFLMQRRVICIAQHLGNLTRCLHALLSLLYPLSWPHTFIPVLPKGLIDVAHAPTPYILGLLTMHLSDLELDLLGDDVLVVDLDGDNLARAKGDETRILPKKLQRALQAAMKMKERSSETQQAVLPEAFLRMFVETLGHYTHYINAQQNGEKLFEKDAFIRAVNSRSIRLFLQWFTETELFDCFIDERMKGLYEDDLFTVRLHEYRNEMEPTVGQAMKKKLKNFFQESGERLRKVFKVKVYV